MPAARSASSESKGGPAVTSQSRPLRVTPFTAGSSRAGVAAQGDKEINAHIPLWLRRETDRPQPHPAPCRTYQLPKTAPSHGTQPRRYFVSRMSPEVSCSGEFEVFPARFIVERRCVPGSGSSPLVLLRFWRTAVTCDTCPSVHAHGRGRRVHAAEAHCRLASGPGPGGSFPKPDSGHTGTISITIRTYRTRWNAMKPRIQCVLTK